MKLAIGSDHAAFEAKETLKALLTSLGHDAIDEGTSSTASCDYPDFAARVAERVVSGDAGQGILLCGTGIGMSIAANKFKGIRAALCHDVETARMSRAHNDANILCMGARVLNLAQLEAITRTWLETPFEEGRHARRLEKIRKFEER